MEPKKLASILERLPQPVMYPLEPGCPCVFYPRGQREDGHAKPAVCCRRDDLAAVVLFEHRCGEGVQHSSVRHVDDPYYVEHPKARNHGAWDYSRGVTYAFLVPAKFTAEHASMWKDLPVEICWAVLQMTNDGIKPSEIAGQLRIEGVTRERVQEIIQIAASL